MTNCGSNYMHVFMKLIHYFREYIYKELSFILTRYKQVNSLAQIVRYLFLDFFISSDSYTILVNVIKTRSNISIKLQII